MASTVVDKVGGGGPSGAAGRALQVREACFPSPWLDIEGWGVPMHPFAHRQHDHGADGKHLGFLGELLGLPRRVARPGLSERLPM